MRVYFRFLVNSWKDIAEFRFDFLMGFLDLLVYMASIFFFWRFVSAGSSEIAGWRTIDLMLLGAFAGLYISLNGFFSGSWYLSGKIMEGDLDKYLARPVNVYFAIMAQSFQIDELIRGILGFTVMLGIYLAKTGCDISFLSLAGAFVVFSCGTLSLVFMKSVVSLLAVWYGEIGAFKLLLHFEDFQFERYPTTFYGRALSNVLNYVICIGLVATIPTAILSGKTIPANYLVGALLCLLAWAALLAVVFKKAIARYESFGG